MKLFGRILFPKAQPYQRLKNMRELAAAVILGVLLAAAVGLSIYFTNRHAR